MRRGIGFLLAALVAFALFATPVTAADGSCVSLPDSAPNSHPGVVLGPATRCVRDDPGTTAPAGSVGAPSDEGRRVPWAPVTASATLISAMGVSAVIRRRRGDAQPTARAA